MRKTNLLLSMCSFFMILVLFSGMGFGAIPDYEREALIAIYNSTGGENWSWDTNWNGPPGTENTWYGVTCDAGNTRVEKLELANNNMVGTLPAELGNLKNLEVLVMGGNPLSGTIPVGLVNLTRLKILMLGGHRALGTHSPLVGDACKS